MVERWWLRGSFFRRAPPECFTISDLSTVWVLVNVFERDLAAVQNGDEVEIKMEAYPSMVFKGST